MMSFYGFLGFSVGKDTSNFLSLLEFLIGFLIVGVTALTMKPLIKDNNKKLFASDAKDKIRIHIFFRKSISLVSFVEFAIVLFILSGLIDGLPVLIKQVLESVVLVLFIMILLGIMSLVDELVSPNFNYYLYRACITLALCLEAQEQFLFMVIGVNYYDKYIRRKIGLTLCNIGTVFNRFVVLSTQQKSQILNLLSASSDTFAPITVMYYNLYDRNGDILIKDSYFEKFKEAIIFVIPLLAGLTSVIELVTRPA